MQTTARRQTHSRLATPELQRLGIALRAFAAVVAHDLSNPLNALAINVELAQMLLRRGDPSRMSDCLQRISADCRRCADLLQDMLAAARQESGQRCLADLSALLRQAAEAARLHCAVAADAIVLPERAAPSLPLDRAAVELALTMVFVDAFQRGAKRVHVDIGKRARDLQLSFCDDGPEIPAEALPRLFEPFVSTGDATQRNPRGSLLLNLARHILCEHGGTLRAENRPTGPCLLATLPQR